MWDWQHALCMKWNTQLLVNINMAYFFLLASSTLLSWALYTASEIITCWHTGESAGASIKSLNLHWGSLGLTLLWWHYNRKSEDEGNADSLLSLMLLTTERQVFLRSFCYYKSQLISVFLNSWNRLAQAIMTGFWLAGWHPAENKSQRKWLKSAV